MGAIAASNSPNRVTLFRTVLAASTSIPGVFAPTFIDVEADGGQYAEMHVDGGVTSNVLAVPEGILVAKGLRAPQGSRVYVVVNGKLAPDAALTSNSTHPDRRPVVLHDRQGQHPQHLDRDLRILPSQRLGILRDGDRCRPFHRDREHQLRYRVYAELFDYGFAKGRSGNGFQTTLDGMRARASQ